MRKVTFYIDDFEYFQKTYNLTYKQLKYIFSDTDSFRVIYTLIGEGTDADRYILTDYDGNKVDINSLDGYQKGVVLNDCYSYFIGEKYYDGRHEPCGVVKIDEEIIDE